MITKKPFLLLFFWKNRTKTAKLWSLRHQKQGFPTDSTFSRKSGSSYEKIGNKHFFMGQNTPPENSEISAHSTLSLNSLLKFSGSLDTFWFSLEWNSSFRLAHSLLLAGDILAILVGFITSYLENMSFWHFPSFKKTLKSPKVCQFQARKFTNSISLNFTRVFHSNFT